jgi:hypothetical protein
MMNFGLIQYRRFSKKSSGPRLWHDVLFVDKNTHTPDLTHLQRTWRPGAPSLGCNSLFYVVTSHIVRTGLHRSRLFLRPNASPHCAAPHYSVAYNVFSKCIPHDCTQLRPTPFCPVQFAPIRLRRCYLVLAYLAPQNEMNPTHVHNRAYIGATSK